MWLLWATMAWRQHPTPSRNLLQSDHASSFWKYCGLHVEHGEAVKRRKGEKLGFNKRMRTLTWKIADSFIKHHTPFYRAIYDEAKVKENEKLGNPISNPSDCPIYGTRYCQHLSTQFEHSFLAYFSCLLLGLCATGSRPSIRVCRGCFWVAVSDFGVVCVLGMVIPNYQVKLNDKNI